MKNILIVDDDIAFLKMIAKRFESFKGEFNPVFVKDGVSAVAQIRKKDISLIISDLQMPKMDGYGLLEYVTDNYPDIPVIIMTAFGRPKSKIILTEKGASTYFEKPVEIDSLIDEIKRLLTKQSDGGTLNSASLEMFTQLVEMEQKTCTIRVKREGNKKDGVLFFRDGELYYARIGGLKGVEAAYKIFGWQNVSLQIENNCRLKKKKIESDLQAVLLEAMRLKDESEDEDSSDLADDSTADKGSSNLEKKVEKKLTPVEYLKKFIEDNSNEVTGISEIYEDDSWKEFLKKSSKLGEFLDGGSLKACYINKNNSDNMIVVPDKDNTVLSISNKCDREKIYRILMD